MPRAIDRPILLCPRCLGSTLFQGYRSPSGLGDCPFCEGYGYISLRRFVFEVEAYSLDPISYLLTTTVTTHYHDNE